MKNKNLIRILLNSINIIGFIFLFLAPIIVISFSIKEKNISIFLWWMFLYLIGLLIAWLIKENNVQHVLIAFSIVYSISTVAVNFIYNDLEKQNGTPFQVSDDIVYHRNALSAVNYGISGFGDAVYYFYKEKGHKDGSYYYTAFIASIYNQFIKWGFDANPIIPRYLNSFFLGLLGLVVFSFGNLINLSINTAKVSGYVASLWPLLLYHSAIIRRDTIFAFFLLVSLYLIAIFLKKKNNINLFRLLVLFISVLIVSKLRTGFFLIYLILLFITIFLYYKDITIKIVYRFKLVHFLFFAFIVLLIFHNHITPEFINENKKEFFEQFSNYLNRRGNYSEKGIGSFIFRLPVVLNIPIRLLYASLSPFPSLTHLSYNIRWLGTIPWFISVPILLRSLVFALKTKEKSYLPIKFLSIAFITYYVVINVVSFTETQQMMYVPLGVLLIFYGIENQKTSLKSIYSINGMIILFVLLYIMYFILKFVI